MLQLARVQDQTNQHLQQHIQQGQFNMQAHAGALHQLTNSTHQRNYDHIFASISLPHNKSWLAIREKLKRCFSDPISLGHTAAQLENMTQKQNEPLMTLYLLLL